MEIYRLALLAAGVLVAAVLLRRWVSSWLAVLGAILLVSTVRLDFKFLAYKPETFGLVLVLFTLWLADRAIVEGSRRLAALAAVVAGVAFLSHAEVFLLLGPGIAGIVLARLLVDPAGGRLGLRRPGCGRARPPLRSAWRSSSAAWRSGAIGNFAATGQLRVLGYVAGAATEGAAIQPPPADEVPAGWTASGDPTWDFYLAAVAPGQAGRPPTSFFDRRLLPRAILHVWPGLDARSGALLVVLLALLAAPVLAWPWLDPRRRRALVVAWVFAVGLFVGSYLLFALSHTYVPARTGPRRLMPYELVLPVISLVVVLWGLDRVLRPGWRALFPRRGATVAAGLLLTVLTVAAIVPAPDPIVDDAPEPGLTVVGYDAYRWLDANLPADARILANAYTDGSIGALARRVGIIDGRAVYLEDRAFLAEATRLALGARVVFADPTGPGAASYLARERVDYLLVAGPGASGADLGGYLPFPTDLDALARGGRFSLVRTFGDGRLLLFRVGPATTGTPALAAFGPSFGVKVNAFGTEDGDRDVALLASLAPRHRPHAIILPKVESAATVEAFLRVCEAAGVTCEEVVPLIETTRGVDLVDDLLDGLAAAVTLARSPHHVRSERSLPRQRPMALLAPGRAGILGDGPGARARDRGPRLRLRPHAVRRAAGDRRLHGRDPAAGGDLPATGSRSAHSTKRR